MCPLVSCGSPAAQTTHIAPWVLRRVVDHPQLLTPFIEEVVRRMVGREDGECAVGETFPDAFVVEWVFAEGWGADAFGSARI
jgi:hypothetical protein